MYRMYLGMLATLTFLAAAPANAQDAPASKAYDPSPRLQEALPKSIRDQVLAVIAEARSRGLPAQALERTALKGAARNVPPAEIERAVVAQSQRLERVQEALSRVPNRPVSDDEIEAGAEAVRNGVDMSSLVELATGAPSGRSLAVPMHVLGLLIARDVPAKDALAAIRSELEARAADAEIARLPERVTERPAGKPALTGRELAGTKTPGGGTPPAGVPANGGADVRPTVPTPPARPGRP